MGTDRRTRFLCLARRYSAFTLVELLVVITIVIVLLALLAPGLEKAIYQAQLATCAAKLDGYHGAMTSGAVTYRRRYPDRPTRYMPTVVNEIFAGGDSRPALRPYLGESLNAMLNDPLSKAVDIDGSVSVTLVSVSYAMWDGFPTGPNQRVMRKLGDRWSWSGGPDGTPGNGDDVEYNFDLLAQDYEFRYATPYHVSSHPDSDNLMWESVLQDTNRETRSSWFIDSDTFGLLDFNVAYQDGSVLRVAEIKPHGPVVGKDEDERMTTVPWYYNINSADLIWFRVPKP